MALERGLRGSIDHAHANFFMNDVLSSVFSVPDGAATCSEGFVLFFLRVPQAVGLYCSCHAAQASKGNFHNTYQNL